MATIRTISLFLLVTIFCQYIYFIYIKFGILNSISASFYKVKNMFRFFVWGISLCVVPFAIHEFKLLMILGIIMLGSVGGFARFNRDQLRFKIHMIGAIGGISLLFISLWIYFDIWFISVFMLMGVALFAIIRRNNHDVWGMEVLAFILLSFGLFLTL